MFASFHQLFTFFQESKAKKKKKTFITFNSTRAQNLYQMLLEFIETKRISSNLSRVIRFFILKRLLQRYLVKKARKTPLFTIFERPRTKMLEDHMGNSIFFKSLCIIYLLGQNTRRLWHLLEQFLFTIRETNLDCYHQKVNVLVALRIALRGKQN